MAITYNQYGSPQIYGAPQVQAGYDRRYRQRYDAQASKNKKEMDILLAAYTQKLADRPPVVRDFENISSNIYEQYYKTAQTTTYATEEDKKKKKNPITNLGYTLSNNPMGANDFLLRATSAKELLQMGNYKKPKGLSGYIAEKAALATAQAMIDDAMKTSRIGGTQLFDLPQESQTTPTYAFDKFEVGLMDELTKKYSALGELKKGLLANETESTADDEGVLFSTNKPYQISNELADMKKNFKTMYETINAEFTKYGQDNRKIGTYQTAYLSEDQLYKKMLHDIRSTYSTFGSVVTPSNVTSEYFNPQMISNNPLSTPAGGGSQLGGPSNYSIDNDILRYLNQLPTTITTP